MIRRRWKNSREALGFYEQFCVSVFLSFPRNPTKKINKHSINSSRQSDLGNVHFRYKHTIERRNKFPSIYYRGKISKIFRINARVAYRTLAMSLDFVWEHNDNIFYSGAMFHNFSRDAVMLKLKKNGLNRETSELGHVSTVGSDLYSYVETLRRRWLNLGPRINNLRKISENGYFRINIRVQMSFSIEKIRERSAQIILKELICDLF